VTDQSVTTGSTTTAVTWTAETVDTDSYWSSGASITLPFTGQYWVSGRVQWASDGTNRRRITVEVNGSDTDLLDHQHVGGVVTHVSQVSGIVSATAGQALRLMVFQNSGGSLVVNPCSIAIIYLGPA
jgi:hypothetical protein